LVYKLLRFKFLQTIVQKLKLVIKIQLGSSGYPLVSVLKIHRMYWYLFPTLASVLIQGHHGHVAMDHKLGRSHIYESPEKYNIPSPHSNPNNDGESPVPTGRSSGPFVGSCKGGAVCVPFVACPAHVRSEEKEYCETLGGRKGVCCTTGKNHTKPFTAKDRHHRFVNLDQATLKSLNRKSKDEMDLLRAREAKLLISAEPTILLPGSASYSHFRNSRRFDHLDITEVTDVASRALEIAIATKAFKDREGVSNLELEMGMIQEDLRSTPLGHTCLLKPNCPEVPEKYRRIDGSCNNRYNSLWGATRTPYSRLLPPSYDDGIWVPRTSQLPGHDLPSPRLITSTVFNENYASNDKLTLLAMQFGQFLAHEITQALDFTYGNGSAISCCSQDGLHSIAPENRHFACMPIEMSPSDGFFKIYKQGCMNFVRSVLAPREDCTLGYAQQMNKVTHFIDGSVIYGSSPEQTGELRSFEGGKLKVFKDFGRDLLPLSKDTDACLTMEQGTACFNSGDTRTNQMITLVVMHTVFMREHNRIASILEKLNPDWDDEQIFLETRQIVIAEFQVITYKEFLPAIIGDLAMEEFDINLAEGNSYSYDYDKKIDPSIINEFSAAAFRYGHSTIDGILKIYGMKRMEQMIEIPEVMFYPSQMRKTKFLDMVLSTLTTERMQDVDSSFPEAVTKYLFRAGMPFGVDLAAINIQRGRDHGIRPYNDYRELSGLPRFTQFSDFGPEYADSLSTVYASVDDIDLWVGGLLEPKDGQGILGKVFRDMIAEQFSRLKKGDRYFFENDPTINPGHFTPEQLVELRKASMSRIICDNNDHILLRRQAKNAFKVPDVPGNEFLDCKSDAIPRMDLSYWSH
ncbi:unnamed protein product, partial [Phaedon cochleariae]